MMHRVRKIFGKHWKLPSIGRKKASCFLSKAASLLRASHRKSPQRMPDIAPFVLGVAHRDLGDLATAADQIPFVALASLNEAVRNDGSTAVHAAVNEALVRLAETSILSHPRLLRLIDVWDGIIGSARER